MASYEPAPAPLPPRQRKAASHDQPQKLAGQGFVTLAQLTLDLPHRAALGAEDFLVSGCNLAAVRLIDSWPQWQDHVQLLIGPSGQRQDPSRQSLAGAVGGQGPRPRHTRHRLIDDHERGDAAGGGGRRPPAYDEKALFHLLNLARENRLFVLLTAQSAPSRWGRSLPDLAVAAERRSRSSRSARPTRRCFKTVHAQAFRRPAARYRSESA